MFTITNREAIPAFGAVGCAGNPVGDETTGAHVPDVLGTTTAANNRNLGFWDI